MKRIISAALSALLIISSSGAFAAVRTDLTSENAASGAMIITRDMIYENAIDITPAQMMTTLFNYSNMSDSSVRAERNASDADFTLYFGEENAKNISLFRAYVHSADTDEITVPITIYGSQDGVSWITLAVMDDPVAAAWNEVGISSDDAYSYLRIESETNDTEDDEIDDDGILTAGDTKTYHQKITRAIFIEEIGEDEDRTAGSSSSAGGGQTTGKTQFSDVAGHWAEDVIKEYTDRGILNGYPDGTFRPDNGVSAAEFSRIVSAIRGIDYRISEGNWALPYIREMLEEGVFVRTDYDDYNTKMRREQVAKAGVALMAGEYYPKDLGQFSQYIADFNEVGQPFGDYVLKTYISGVLTGYEDDTWRPQREVTRAEILSILDRVFNKDIRQKPEAISGISTDSPEMAYFYSAAVQVRNSQNASSMQYRLFGSDAQYMEEDDASTGLKMESEIQGAQGFGMVVRYDVSQIKEKRDKLKRLYLDATWLKGGSDGHELGIWYYTYAADKVEWNNSLYFKNLNGSAVASDDLTGYNSIVSNITATLPTWGNSAMAVPNEQKTKPVAKTVRNEDNKYIFELTDMIDEVLDKADDSGVVEFIITSVNYDGLGMDEDKPHIYIAGENAPKLNAEYDIQSGNND